MKSKKSVTIKEFKILLSFLAEKNEGTLTLVKDQLKTVLSAHPRYQEVIQDVKDPRVKKTAQSFLEEVRFQLLEPEFEKLFAQGPNLDLEHGLFLLASLDYPSLKPKDISVPLMPWPGMSIN